MLHVFNKVLITVKAGPAGHSSLAYGAAIVLAFAVPWLLLPGNLFVDVVLFYAGAAVGLMFIICVLGAWRDLRSRRKPGRPNTRTSGFF